MPCDGGQIDEAFALCRKENGSLMPQSRKIVASVPYLFAAEYVFPFDGGPTNRLSGLKFRGSVVFFLKHFYKA